MTFCSVLSVILSRDWFFSWWVAVNLLSVSTAVGFVMFKRFADLSGWDFDFERGL